MTIKTRFFEMYNEGRMPTKNLNGRWAFEFFGRDGARSEKFLTGRWADVSKIVKAEAKAAGANDVNLLP